MHNRSDGNCGSVFWFKIPYVADIVHGDNGSTGASIQLSNQTAKSVRTSNQVRNSFSSMEDCDGADPQIVLEAFDGFYSSVFKNRVRPHLDETNHIHVELPVLVDEEPLDDDDADASLVELALRRSNAAPKGPREDSSSASSSSTTGAPSKGRGSIFSPFRPAMNTNKVQPQADAGACVELRFPEPVQVTNEKSVGGDSLVVFVVDDSPSIRKLMKRTLEKLGVGRVELFENGDLALQAMMKKEAAVVFMDIQMPVMSGPEVGLVFSCIVQSYF